jgi:hypothetical protein
MVRWFSWMRRRHNDTLTRTRPTKRRGCFNTQRRFELLEARALLSADTITFFEQPSVLDIAEAWEHRADPLGGGLAQVGNWTEFSERIQDYLVDDKVYLSLRGRNSADALASALTSVGFEIRATASDEALIEGYAPLSALSKIARSPEVLSSITISLEGQTDSVGSVINEADAGLRATIVRDRFGAAANGQGIVIGVISDGVDGCCTF